MDDRSRRAAIRCGLLAAAAALMAQPALAGGRVAAARPETAARGTLSVTSPGFKPNGALPARYSLQGGDRSPPLQWSRAPGAQSYAVIAEDSDAPGASPYVHWIAWNIPASVTALPEGVPHAAR